MKFLKKLVLFLIVLVAALAIISQFLPATFKMERTIIVQAGPEKVYPWVNDLRHWPEWTVWTKEADPTVVYTYEGPNEGVGAVSKWQSKKWGDGMMTITESDPAKGVKIDLSFAGSPPAKGWITFAPAGTDTKVIWGFGGDVSRNPIHRWMMVFMEKLAGPEFDKNLQGLKKKAETNPAAPAL